MARLLVAALLAGAGLAFAAPAAPTVSNAWLRALPGNLPAGGYFTITNSGAAPIVLTGAASPACGSAMLHMTHQMDGVAHMMMVESVTVPAGGRIEFAPGGYHVMCMDPKNLKPGTSVPVTLHFADGATLTVPFAVRDATGH
jgi:periplasmic copper chaperone A